MAKRAYLLLDPWPQLKFHSPGRSLPIRALIARRNLGRGQLGGVIAEQFPSNI